MQKTPDVMIDAFPVEREAAPSSNAPQQSTPLANPSPQACDRAHDERGPVRGREYSERAHRESSTPQKKLHKRDVHGWIVLDKPVGMTSTHAVAVAKRLFAAKRAGHAGTLDPLASGSLPIALGDATKTVPFVVDSRKSYVFTVRWGEERDTDDAEGRVVATSERRPDAEAIAAALPVFTGTIEQVPPRFSAVKIEGARAYDLAREGEVVNIAPRAVTVHRLELVEMPDRDHAVLTAECGKGTYVRAIARDLGRALRRATDMYARFAATASAPLTKAP